GIPGGPLSPPRVSLPAPGFQTLERPAAGVAECRCLRAGGRPKPGEARVVAHRAGTDRRVPLQPSPAGAVDRRHAEPAAPFSPAHGEHLGPRGGTFGSRGPIRRGRSVPGADLLADVAAEDVTP